MVIHCKLGSFSSYCRRLLENDSWQKVQCNSNVDKVYRKPQWKMCGLFSFRWRRDRAAWFSFCYGKGCTGNWWGHNFTQIECGRYVNRRRADCSTLLISPMAGSWCTRLKQPSTQPHINGAQGACRWLQRVRTLQRRHRPLGNVYHSWRHLREIAILWKPPAGQGTSCEVGRC